MMGLKVGVLNQEGGAELAELADLNLAGAVLVDLLQDLLKLLFRGPEANRDVFKSCLIRRIPKM